MQPAFKQRVLPHSLVAGVSAWLEHAELMPPSRAALQRVPILCRVLGSSSRIGHGVGGVALLGSQAHVLSGFAFLQLIHCSSLGMGWLTSCMLNVSECRRRLCHLIGARAQVQKFSSWKLRTLKQCQTANSETCPRGAPRSGVLRPHGHPGH